MRRSLIIIGILMGAVLMFVGPAYSRVNFEAADVGGGGCSDCIYSEKAYQHLYERMDKYNTGSTLRLIEGQSEPYPPSQEYTAWVYDNALAIIALVARGRPEDISRARLLCESLIWAQDNDPEGFTDGRLRDAYWANNLINENGAAILDPNTSTGNMAWVIIAWLRYYRDAADPDQAFRTQILNAAVNLGNFIENNYWRSQGPYPGYLIGYTGWLNQQTIDPYIKSTEHNADLYIAFKKLFEATGVSNWQSQALKARDFVYSMRNSSESRYFVGTTSYNTINTIPEQQALDANTMAILALEDYTPFNWLENNCRLTSDGFTGFDFNIDRDGIWFEGTAQMSVAYFKVGRAVDSAKYKNQLRRAQFYIPAPRGNGKGIVSASHDGVTTGFSWWYLFKTMSIAPTCWFIFVESNINPFN